MEKMMNAYKMLIGIAEGKRSLKRPSCKWEDSIKMDLRNMCLEGADAIHLA
jgi:hypothetical protein